MISAWSTLRTIAESHLESQEFHSSQSKDGEDAQAQREEKYSDCDDDNDDNDDDDDDDDALSNALSSMHLHPENPTLERLDLEDADIDADRLVELLHACSLLPNLRILQLSSNALGYVYHILHMNLYRGICCKLVEEGIVSRRAIKRQMELENLSFHYCTLFA